MSSIEVLWRYGGILLMSFMLGCSSFRQKCEISEDFSDSKKVKILSYKARLEKGKILILPPTGGMTYFEKKYARKLCEKSFSSFIITSWEGMNEERVELEIHDKLLSRGQWAIAQVLKEKTTPGEFVGILGTSVGGIHGATALGSLKPVQAGFIIVGGGSVHEVIAYSEEKTLAKYRKIRMKKFNFKTKKEYAEALKQKIPLAVEPLAKSSDVKGKKSFLVIAKRDQTIPTPYQKKMAQAFGSQILEFSGGHISTIFLFGLFHKKKVLSFFEQALAEFNAKSKK